jgi:hypothetical protein
MARFVLAHGAFSGAWIWGPLIDHLKAAGQSVDGFDLRARKSSAPIERPGPRPSKVC